MTLSPFERDIVDQPEALRRFGQAYAEPFAPMVRAGAYDRIILTGMGSSHFAALPTWRRLVARGLPAWWVDTGQLLDAQGLLTPSSLIVATSQSGASGELVALVEAREALVRNGSAPKLVAVTNDPQSPLAAAADAVLLLHSGTEATVSTKSYLNTLAAHDLLTAELLGVGREEVDDVAKAVEASDGDAEVEHLAAAYASWSEPRLAFVGFGDQAATALYAGLITKEGAKIPAEGFVGGEFRHGPLELAGPGLLAVLFADAQRNQSLQRLGDELVEAGSTVATVGGLDVAGATLAIRHPAPSGPVGLLSLGALFAQQLTVAIARTRGIVPGAFAYGNKVTTAL
jgi:glucosamine--fructose-6-phosphate aminotransferase (isomerizing)